MTTRLSQMSGICPPSQYLSSWRSCL